MSASSSSSAAEADANRKNDNDAADDDDDDTATTAAPKAALTAEAKAAARAMQNVGAHEKSNVDDSKVDKVKVNAALQELARKNAEARQRRLLEVQQLAAVNVSNDDVALLARELLLSNADAELTLRKHNGSVEAALRAFVAS